MKKLIYGHTNIEFLENKIIRFEYSPNDIFSDTESFFVPFKKEDLDAKHELVENGNDVEIKFLDLVLKFDKNNVLPSLRIFKDNKQVYRYKYISNSGELPLPNKTPYVFPLMDSPRILIPETGYDKTSEYQMDRDVRDVYLMYANKDYKLLRKQYISLTGKNDMPRFKNFGLWNSRYYAYKQDEALRMIRYYADRKIPLDNFVLDTDWRIQTKKAGTGYDVNTELFPDLDGFLHQAHKMGVEVFMNDHPNPTKRSNTIFSKEEMEFRKTNLTSFLEKGLDAWWYDRNWWTSLVTPSKRIPIEPLATYAYLDITKDFFQGFVLDPEVYVRPVTLSNISNIKDGKYIKINNSRTHTQTITWSGDIKSTMVSLENEVKNMVKCANNMVGYYSSDIGGHQSNPGNDEFIRWYQFGLFSPICRPHATCAVAKFREPWVHGKETLEVIKSYIDMRYRLLNVIYTEAYKHYEEGLGLIRPLYLNYPTDLKARKHDNEYMLSSILVAPITGEATREVDIKEYKSKSHAYFYNGLESKGKIIRKRTYDVLDMEKGDDLPDEFSFIVKGKLRFKKDVDLYFKSNANVKIYISNKMEFGDKYEHAYEESFVAKLEKNKDYTFRIKGATSNKDFKFIFKVKNDESRKKQKIYLPDGYWYDLFNAGYFKGKRYVNRRYKINEYPLFVKAGSLLPLYKNVENAGTISFKNIIYDFYPSFDMDVKSFFYEDDKVTTGYKVGVYRKNNYHLYADENSFNLKLMPSSQVLDNDVSVRNAIVKLHVPGFAYIEKAFINGEEVKLYRHDHKKHQLPFSNNQFACDSKTAVIKFRQEIKKEYIISFKIRK